MEIPGGAKELDALLPKSATEMVAGKKYLIVFAFEERLPDELFTQLRESTPAYESYFKSRGIDATVLITTPPMKVKLYELEGGSAVAPNSSN